MWTLEHVSFLIFLFFVKIIVDHYQSVEVNKFFLFLEKEILSIVKENSILLVLIKL